MKECNGRGQIRNVKRQGELGEQDFEGKLWEVKESRDTQAIQRVSHTLQKRGRAVTMH